MIRVLGIDPGLAATGVGVVSGAGRRVAGAAYGAVRTPAGDPLPARLDQIYEAVASLLREQAPSLMVVEDVFSLGRYPKSGITLGRVSGVILLAGQRHGVPVMEVPVREAKKVLTGNGGADKAQLERAVRHVLKLTDPIRPDHASDALALALIGLFRHGDAPRRVIFPAAAAC